MSFLVTFLHSLCLLSLRKLSLSVSQIDLLSRFTNTVSFCLSFSSSPSTYSRSLSNLSDTSDTFIFLSHSLSLHFKRTFSSRSRQRSSLSLPLSVFLSFFASSSSPLALSFSYTHSFGRTCQPRLDSTKYARVSPRATLVIPRDCVRRYIRTIHDTHVRTTHAAAPHGRVCTRVNAATCTRDGQTPFETFADLDVAVSKSPSRELLQPQTRPRLFSQRVYVAY